MLRSADPQLWREFKAKAVLKGVTLTQLVEELIKAYLKKNKNKD